jgi:hypothetical protein
VGTQALTRTGGSLLRATLCAGVTLATSRPRDVWLGDTVTVLTLAGGAGLPVGRPAAFFEGVRRWPELRHQEQDVLRLLRLAVEAVEDLLAWYTETYPERPLSHR